MAIKTWQWGAIAAAAAAVAWGGGTYALASKTQSTYEASMKQLREMLPTQVKVTESRYERHFSGATSTTTFEFGCDDKKHLLTVKDTIQHGPLAGGGLSAAVVDTELLSSDLDKAMITRLFGTDKPLSIHTVVDLSGKSVSKITLAKLSFAEDGKPALTMQPLSATVTGRAGATDFEYDLTLPGVELDDPANHTRMTLGAVQSHGTSQPLPGQWMIQTGTAEYKVASLDLTTQPPGSAESVHVSLTDLTGKGTTSHKDGLIESVSSMGGKGLVQKTAIDRFDMQSSVRRLHAPTYQDLMTKFMNVSLSCDKPDEQTTAAMGKNMLGALKVLAEHGPEFSLDHLRVDYAGQRGEMTYSISVKPTKAADMPDEPAQLLARAGQFKGSFRVPVKWLEQIAAGSADSGKAPPPEAIKGLLSQAETQGMVKLDGDFVTSEASFEGGQLLVNGKPMGPKFGAQ